MEFATVFLNMASSHNNIKMSLNFLKAVPDCLAAKRRHLDVLVYKTQNKSVYSCRNKICQNLEYVKVYVHLLSSYVVVVIKVFFSSVLSLSLLMSSHPHQSNSISLKKSSLFVRDCLPIFSFDLLMNDGFPGHLSLTYALCQSFSSMGLVPSCIILIAVLETMYFAHCVGVASPESLSSVSLGILYFLSL